MELAEPSGWTNISLRQPASASSGPGGGPGGGECLRAYFLQLAVLSNHQNGRDSHIRQVRIFGPSQEPLQTLGQPLQFATVEFSQFAGVR